jgi:hypothetical protein
MIASFWTSATTWIIVMWTRGACGVIQMALKESTAGCACSHAEVTRVPRMRKLTIAASTDDGTHSVEGEKLMK